jgi:uncharacterized protein YcfJ
MRTTLLFFVLMASAGLAQADRHYPRDRDYVVEVIPVQSGASAVFADHANVLSSTPIIQQVNTPRQECWTDSVTTTTQPQAGDRSYAGAVIGGIAGGLLGHTVGKGSGKDVATVAGAVTGAVVGDNVDNRNGSAPVTQTQQNRHCRNIDNWSQQVTGYTVVFRYLGRDFSTVLPYNPGAAVQLTVAVTPAAKPPQNGYAPPVSAYPAPGAYPPPGSYPPPGYPPR